jgi:hypothetical protein
MAYVPRSRLAQLYQMGKETTPGVGGTANKRFPTIAPVLEPTGGNPQQIRHAGGKMVGSVVMGDLMSEGAGTSNIDFNEVVYIAASNVNYAAPTGAGPYVWTFSQDPDQPDTVKTYVAQRGSSGAVQTYRNVAFTDMGFHFERTGVSTMTYRAIGRFPTLGTTLDSATGVTQAPLGSTKSGLYTGASYAALASGGTRFDPYGFSLDFHNNNRFGPDFVLDDSVDSFAFTTEGEVDCGGTVTVAFDVTSTDFSGVFTAAALKAGTDLFIGVENLVSTTAYLKLHMHIQIAAPPTQAQIGNVRAYTWPFTCIPDATDNRGFKLLVKNAVADI